MNIYGLVLTLIVTLALGVLLFFWAIPKVKNHNNGTDTFVEFHTFFEDYGQMEQYHCVRGKCDGRNVLEVDRDTHNVYHDAVDNGLPNPYAFDNEFDDEYDYSL